MRVNLLRYRHDLLGRLYLFGRKVLYWKYLLSLTIAFLVGTLIGVETQPGGLLAPVNHQKVLLNLARAWASGTVAMLAVVFGLSGLSAQKLRRRYDVWQFVLLQIVIFTVGMTLCV